jgi:CheY-like chemotaxis protein
VKKILLVEDREDDIIMARRVIKKISGDYELLVARDGEQALDLLTRPNSDTYDLVFLDIQLPKLNGFEVLRSIRADKSVAHQAVVVLTSSSSQADIAEAERLGANLYVTKPLGIEEFETSMKSILARFIC